MRGSQRVKKAMPILVEIKTGQEQNGRTNPQQALREAESYTQGLQQNNRPFVTLADRVIRVGFNMDYANPIEISVAELQPPVPIIRSIFESVNSILRGQERRDDIKTTITDQLKKIYKLSPGIQGSSEPQYLSRLFIGHLILNTIENDETRIDKRVLTYKKLQKTTRGTRRNHDITTSVFVERTIAGSNTGDSRVLIIHFHEGGRSNVDINDPTLRVPLNGIINQANCKEVIELYVDARSGNDGSLKFLTEDNNVVIQDFTNSVNDYFQANVANHWEIHNMPNFNQADNLKKALDATMNYQPQRGQDSKVDLGPYGDMFANIGKNLFSVKSLITSEAYFAAVLSGLLNSYSDIEFDQGDFKINVRPEFQVGGGERIDLFINVMSKNPADSDVLIGLELKYGDGRITVDSMERTLEKAEKVQLRRYGISRNIRAITEGANFFVTLPVGFVSRAEDSGSLVITREQFVAYDIERSFLGQVHKHYRYWLSDQDIRRIAHLDNTYSNMFDVHAMNNNYDTSSRGLVVVTGHDQGVNTGELHEQIRQFIDNVDNNRIVQQQGVPTRTFIVNQGGDHWTTLVISQQNGQYNGYYLDSLGSGIPDNIRQILTDNNIINPIDFQIHQQTDDYNCGFWALENARDINTMLRENRNLVWLRAQLAPERLSRNSEQYFIDKRKEFAQIIRDNQPNGDSSQHGGGFQSCNKNKINKVIEQSKYLNIQEDLDSFEYQTEHGNYNYWLQQHDIADIARVLYNYGSDTANTLFEITGTPEHLANQLRQFQDRVYTQKETRPLTLIINISNNHWVTLVVFYHNGQYHGYYVDSLYDSTKDERHEIPDNIRQVLENQNINNIIDFRIHQQDDGHNCGLWSLENANNINIVLHENILNNVPINNTEIHRRLEIVRDETYFENLRLNLVSRLREDDLRIDHLSELGYVEVDQFLNTQFCLATLAFVGTMPKRSINDCKINSKVFLNYIKDIENDSKRTQLIQSMNKFEIVGDSKHCSSINQLIYHQEITNYLNKPDKVVNIKISVEDDELTPLHLAAYYGDNNRIVSLIEQGVSVDVRSKDNWTPLHLASQYANQEGANLLIKNKADPHAYSTHWWTPLHLAAQSGDMEVLRELIKSFKARRISISIKARGGWTPLHLAIQFGHQDTIDFLIEQGADLNAPASGGWTPLLLAARYNNYDAAHALLEKEIFINFGVKAHKHWTPLHFAAHFNNKKMINLLINKGADQSIKDEEELTALQLLEHNNKTTEQSILGVINVSNSESESSIQLYTVAKNKNGVKNELRRRRMLEDSKHEIVSNRETNEVKHRGESGAYQALDDFNVRVRDDKGDMFLSSSSGDALIPLGYNIAKWVCSSISKLKYLNLVQQIKRWFSNDESRIDEGRLDIPNNLEYENSEILKLNQDVLYGKLLKIEDQQKLMFIANNESVSNVVNYDLLDAHGNLLLLNLLIRKKNGVKYKQADVMISNDSDIAYAQSLAYVAYAPKGLSNLSQQFTANAEIITELNENLKVLQTELEESIECISDINYQRQEFQQADSQQCNSRYSSAHAYLVHGMSALHVDNNIGYCNTTNLNHVIEQYPQIVPNYT
ncbi:MAG: ankyrin repeat domain-containing protein [Rickettsia sp.]|uniref:ankyrin repeat domain-containing protein n=1 Tax=Rickettsia sp. TaxID=789 RepID=UPI00397868C1